MRQLSLGTPGQPVSPLLHVVLQGTSRDDFGRLVLGDVIVGLKGRTVKSEKDLFDILDGCKVRQAVWWVVGGWKW